MAVEQEEEEGVCKRAAAAAAAEPAHFSFLSFSAPRGGFGFGDVEK